MLAWDDTIAALASAAGPASRGILRVSGGATREVVSGLVTTATEFGWATRKPVRFPAEIRLDGARAPIAVEVQWWPGTRSYTGQPLAELHVAGSPPLLQRLLGELYRRGARAAQPGEFTLRAFLNGKLDLLQAEAVLGVIDATDQQQLQTALHQLAGGVSQRMSQLRGELLELLADLEAGLDFVEEHLEFVGREEVQRRLDEATAYVAEVLQQSQRRLHAGERPRVVLAGLPNAGKSTLFNRLAATEQALVSPTAGTTRDYLSTAWVCQGLVVDLIDTAGWDQETTTLSEAMHASRSGQLQLADLVLWCTAADANAAERQEDTRLQQRSGVPPERLLPVMTKADATNTPPVHPGSVRPVVVSAHRGAGLDALEAAVLEKFTRHGGGQNAWIGSSAARCQEALHRAEQALGLAAELALMGGGDELIAAELRSALESLGVIAGEVYTDDLLDRIFSKFCIGK